MSDKETYQYIIMKGYIHKIPIKKEIPIIKNNTKKDQNKEKDEHE